MMFNPVGLAMPIPDLLGKKSRAAPLDLRARSVFHREVEFQQTKCGKRASRSLSEPLCFPGYCTPGQFEMQYRGAFFELPNKAVPPRLRMVKSPPVLA